MDTMDIGRVINRKFAKFKKECIELLKSYDSQLHPDEKTFKIVNEDAEYLKAGFYYQTVFYYIETYLKLIDVNPERKFKYVYTGWVNNREYNERKHTDGTISGIQIWLEKWLNENHVPRKIKESVNNFTRGGDVKQAIGIGREKLLGDFVEEENKKVGINTFFDRLKMEDKGQIFMRAIKKANPEITRLLMSDPSINPAMRKNAPIAEAGISGNPEVINILLADPRVNPGDNHNLALFNAVEKNHLDAVIAFLADSRVNPADAKESLDKQLNIVIDKNYIIREAASENHIAIVKELLKDPRVETDRALSIAVSKISKVGVKAKEWIPLIELLLSNPKTEITPDRRKTIEARIKETNSISK